MDHPELSLGPYSGTNCSPSGLMEGRQYQYQYQYGRKGKSVWEEEDPVVASTQGDIDLQLKHHLPLDWEQCLDLQSGRMYYLNRKTLEKRWERPCNSSSDQRTVVDLDLKMSTPAEGSSSHGHTKGRRGRGSSSSSSSAYRRGQEDLPHSHPGGRRRTESSSSSTSSSNMVAVSCLRCHLLVMLSRSYPSCPNCKYLHSLPQNGVDGSETKQPLETLSLMH